MAKSFQQLRLRGLTDEAVFSGTGKSWGEWCRILDKAGARMMEHHEIKALLQTQLGVPRWWSQTVAAGYESERGLHLSDGGEPPANRYEVTLNKNVAVPRETAWAAWQDPAILARWLPGAEFQVAKTAAPKMMELGWPDRSRVTVRFSERRGRTTVTVTHASLAEKEAARMRAFWSAALDALRVLLAG